MILSLFITFAVLCFFLVKCDTQGYDFQIREFLAFASQEARRRANEFTLEAYRARLLKPLLSERVSEFDF